MDYSQWSCDLKCCFNLYTRGLAGQCTHVGEKVLLFGGAYAMEEGIEHQELHALP